MGGFPLGSLEIPTFENHWFLGFGFDFTGGKNHTQRSCGVPRFRINPYISIDLFPTWTTSKTCLHLPSSLMFNWSNKSRLNESVEECYFIYGIPSLFRARFLKRTWWFDWHFSRRILVEGYQQKSGRRKKPAAKKADKVRDFTGSCTMVKIDDTTPMYLVFYASWVARQ